MRAWFETHINRAVFQKTLVLHRIYGIDFGVWSAAANMIALTNDLSVMYHHCSHHRVGRCPEKSAASQLQAAAHVLFVCFLIHFPN